MPDFDTVNDCQEDRTKEGKTPSYSGLITSSKYVCPHSLESGVSLPSKKTIPT